MSKDLQHILQSIGFTDRESKIYLTGLSMGTAPASDYAKKTSLNRITAYNVLEDLVRRGYFTMVKQERGKWYSPVAPEYLAVEVRKSADAFERSLPELRSLQDSSNRKPHVRFFSGWEGVRRIYEDTLTAETEILNFANSSVIRSHWPTYDKEYVLERVKRGIHLRGIAPNDSVGQDVHGKDKESLRDIRLVSEKEFDFTNEVNIYDHKFTMVSFGEHAEDMFGIIIESKEVAETQRQIFEMAWKFAEKFE